MMKRICNHFCSFGSIRPLQYAKQGEELGLFTESILVAYRGQVCVQLSAKRGWSGAISGRREFKAPMHALFLMEQP
jgi:hypothetical protein